ncbi:MAG: glutathione S-transferase family protein [Pseudomonadota bacterium]
MTKPYVLHYAPDNASLIIRLALNEMDVPFDPCLVDRAASAQKSEAYRRLNPNGLIPVLETPDGPLFETAAILLWLIDRHAMLGPQADDPRRGRFLSWLFFVSNTLHPALRMLFYTSTYIGSDERELAQLSAVTAREALRIFDMLDTEAGRDQAAFGSEDVSALDFYVAACMRWVQLYPKGAPHCGIFASENWPNLHQMAAHLESRQSVADWCRSEGVGSAPFTKPDYPNPPEGSAL